MKKIMLLFVLCTFFLCVFSQEAVIPLGSGTETDPYQISNWQNLYWISVRDSLYDAKLSSHYIQTANIDFPSTINEWDESKGWLPIGYGTLSESHSFSGIYDGQNHKISNIFINRPSEDMLGLFGVSDHAIIRNIGLENVNITASWGASGIVGEMDNSTLISNCYVKGNILGEAFVGGITGYNNAGEINNCYFIGSLEGLEAIAAIAAYNDAGIIDNCYAAATVSEGDYAGILIGCNDAGTINNSLWDIDLAGDINGIGDNSEGTSTNVEGKSTAEMKLVSTYTPFLFDFTNLWSINENINESYPSFIWEANTNHSEIQNPSINTAKLYQAYPNPFNPNTTISFDLNQSNFVSVQVYNAKGQFVKTLTNQHYSQGHHSLQWDGKDQSGQSSASGVYFFKLISGNTESVKKAVLIK